MQSHSPTASALQSPLSPNHRIKVNNQAEPLLRQRAGNETSWFSCPSFNFRDCCENCMAYYCPNPGALCCEIISVTIGGTVGGLIVGAATGSDLGTYAGFGALCALGIEVLIWQPAIACARYCQRNP